MEDGFDPNDFHDLADFTAFAQRQEMLRRMQQRQGQQPGAPTRRGEKPPPPPPRNRQCPWCGGLLAGQFVKCQNCGSDIAWVKGLPYQPGKQPKSADEQFLLGWHHPDEALFSAGDDVVNGTPAASTSTPAGKPITQWYVRLQAQEFPLTDDEIKRWIALGRIHPYDYIRKGAEGEWLKASSFPELLGKFPVVTTKPAGETNGPNTRGETQRNAAIAPNQRSTVGGGLGKGREAGIIALGIFAVVVLVLALIVGLSVDGKKGDGTPSTFQQPSRGTESYGWPGSEENEVYNKFRGTGMNHSDSVESTRIIKEMTERDRKIRRGEYSPKYPSR